MTTSQIVSATIPNPVSVRAHMFVVHTEQYHAMYRVLMVFALLNAIIGAEVIALISPLVLTPLFFCVCV
jgi:hypothetical protein